jgi:hypothetical protein
MEVGEGEVGPGLHLTMAEVVGEEGELPLRKEVVEVPEVLMTLWKMLLLRQRLLTMLTTMIENRW